MLFRSAVREICTAVSLRSPSTVHSHLNTLCSLGYLSRDERKTRSITLTRPITPQNQVAILGSVAAGAPILAEENIEGYIPYDCGKNSSDYYALRIRGDSMIDAGILDDDLVVVKIQNTAFHGEIVIPLIDNEATCKRLYRKDGKVLLMPENPEYEPIDGRYCSILGVVKGLYREY